MDELTGYKDNPQQRVEAVFTDIHTSQMADMPFCQPGISVKASPFQLMDGQWVGAIVTPWMLSLLILPGSENPWPKREVTAKLGIQLAGGDYPFTVGEHERLGQYLACSLMSPLSGITDQAQAEHLLSDVSRLAWALPVETVDPHKRRLLNLGSQR